MPGDHGVIGEMHVENYYWHSMSVEEVVNVLSTNLQIGLSSSEAERRLRVYGLNEIPVKKKSPLVMFARQFANFLIGILLVATAVSAFLGEIVDALAIFAVVLLMGVFGFIQEYRSEKTLEALKRLATPKCRVLRDGVEQEIEASKLVPGDVVLLREGDRVPADLRIVEADNLEVDESPLTGESVPVAKQPALVHEESTPVSDRRNMAYLGTYVVRGRGKGVVVATGLNTELGKIAKAVAEVKEEKTPLEVELDYFGKRIGAIILGISAIVFATSLYVSREGFIQALMIAIALAVAAVPEGLPAIATAVLAIGAYRMARKNAIVKRLAAVEALGSVDIICADKTGTITKGEMTVKVIKLLDNECSVEGVGFEPKGEIKCRENTGLESLYEMIAAHTWTDAKLVREPNGWVIKGSPT
ncbi:MAG: HAD-IC family P-type ATPase, partial [Desulfurococcaceae archaeon]